MQVCYNKKMEKLLSIQKMAQLTGVSTHTLRYYEKLGLLKDIKRDKNGYRLFSEKDMQWLLFLMKLRETAMPISQMKTFSNLRHEGDTTVRERRRILESHQKAIEEQIASLQANLYQITKKIDIYKSLETPVYVNSKKD